MTDIQVVDSLTGKVYPSWAVQAVDALFQKLRNKPMWEGIDFLVEVYFKRFPQAGADLKAKQAETRAGHHNRYGSNRDRDMRVVADIPEALSDLLDYFYHDEIEEDKKGFYRRFVTRYPIFKTPETI